MEKDITYFERPGKINTPRVIKLAKMRAGESGIADIIVASLTGESALKVAEVFGEQMNIVCVRFIPGASWSVTDEYGANHAYGSRCWRCANKLRGNRSCGHRKRVGYSYSHKAVSVYKDI